MTIPDDVPTRPDLGQIPRDCPVPHAGGRQCWLCGSVWRARVTAWVYAQWVRAGRPVEEPR